MHPSITSIYKMNQNVNINATEVSFYIPLVSTEYGIDDIKYTFRLLNIGEVRRVDFVTITPKNSSWITEDEPNQYRSVFVHMDYMYESPISTELMFCINNNTQYKLWVDSYNFWWIAKNYKPVQDTDLNIHQVVENARLLEELVIKQGEQIRLLDQTVYQLHNFILKNYKNTRESMEQSMEEQEDNDSDSTHSSMPGLIYADEDSDDSVKNRIQFSAELCGNH